MICAKTAYDVATNISKTDAVSAQKREENKCFLVIPMSTKSALHGERFVLFTSSFLHREAR